MNRFLRRFRDFLVIHLEAFLELRATPTSYVQVARPEWATGFVPAPPDVVQFTALEGRRNGRLAFVLDDILGTSRARFEVFRVVSVNGAPNFVAVGDSGPQEIQPARWSWRPPSAGTYRIRATRTREGGTLTAQIDHYDVPLLVKLEAHQRAGGVRMMVQSVTNQIPAAVLPNLAVKYMFAVVRTDLPDQQAMFRSFFDPADSDPGCEFDLVPGIYTLLAAAGQFSTVHGFAAMGDQVVMDFTVG